MQGGAFCAETGVHTGRSPKDKHVVVDALTENTVWWGGNRKLSQANFQPLYDDMIAHARGRTLYAQDLYGGANAKYRMKARVFTELAWHSLFIRQLLIRPNVFELADFIPDLTIVDMPSFKADPTRHGVRSDTVIVIDFTKKIILIGNSSYAGEMKKSVFTTLNFYLPAQSVMPMHCSANVGKSGDVALFFGLSGTGKTTLVGRSEPHADRRRRARLERGGRLQFRRRLLRQMHQSVRRSRAADLGRNQSLRRRFGKCHVRSGYPGLRFRKRQAN